MIDLTQVKVLQAYSALDLERQTNEVLRDFQEKGWHVENIQYGGITIADMGVTLGYSYSLMITYKLPFKKYD